MERQSERFIFKGVHNTNLSLSIGVPLIQGTAGAGLQWVNIEGNMYSKELTTENVSVAEIATRVNPGATLTVYRICKTEYITKIITNDLELVTSSNRIYFLTYKAVM